MRQHYRMLRARRGIPEGFKRCSRCGQLKPMAEFGRSNGNPDGRKYQCSPCDKEIQRDYRARNMARNGGPAWTVGGGR